MEGISNVREGSGSVCICSGSVHSGRSILVRIGESDLEVTDDRANLACGEKSSPKGTRPVFADRRQCSQGGANLYRHMGELPTDLVFYGFRSVRDRQADGSYRIRSCAKCVSPHVADRYGLAGGSGSGQGSGICNITSSDATDESTTDFLRGVQLSPGERTSAGDGSARPFITRSVGLKQPQDPLCTVSCPCGDKAAVGLAERLRRFGHSFAPTRSVR